MRFVSAPAPFGPEIPSPLSSLIFLFLVYIAMIIWYLRCLSAPAPSGPGTPSLFTFLFLIFTNIFINSFHSLFVILFFFLSILTIQYAYSYFSSLCLYIQCRDSSLSPTLWSNADLYVIHLHYNICS